MHPSSAPGKSSVGKDNKGGADIPRAITINIFSASAVLALESLQTEEDFSAEIQQGLEFLKGVQAQNLVAKQAIKFLEDVIYNN